MALRLTAKKGPRKILEKEESEDSLTSKISRISAFETKATISHSQIDECQLTPLLAYIAAAISQEAVESLHILGGTIDCCEVEEIPDLPINLRQGRIESKAKIFNPITLEKYDACEEEYKVQKFQQDRMFLEKVIYKLYYSLMCTLNFYPLVSLIKKYKNNVEFEQDLLKDTAKKQQEYDKLFDELDSCKINHEKDLEELINDIGKTKDKIEDALQETSIISKYVSRWEGSRNEQNHHIHQDREKEYLKSIKTSTLNSEREDRVHDEIVNWNKIALNDCADAINKWMTKYEKDLETHEADISRVTIEVNEEKEAVEKLRATIELHDTEMREFIEYKDKKRQADEELARLNKHATRIQSWWRGTMFRKGLGPYRKKKGKKGKDKDKKKGKGKKGGKKK